MERKMAKGNCGEAKEEGEISDDEADEGPARAPLNSLFSLSHNPTSESQPLTVTAPTQFMGRSNRSKPKVGSAKFIRGPRITNVNTIYRNSLPSSKRMLPSLMQVHVQPSKGFLRSLPKSNSMPTSHSSHTGSSDKQAGVHTDRQGGFDRMMKGPVRDSMLENMPKKSPGTICILYHYCVLRVRKGFYLHDGHANKNSNLHFVCADCIYRRRFRDSSPTGQFTDTYFGDSSPTHLETVHRHIF